MPDQTSLGVLRSDFFYCPTLTIRNGKKCVFYLLPVTSYQARDCLCVINNTDF